MIWARPLSTFDGDFEAAPMLARTGLSPAERALVVSGLERLAIVTGLDSDSREALADAIGVAWLGGTADAGVVRFSPAALEKWSAALPEALATAFARLQGLDRPLPALTLGERRFDWQRTHVMGVVNVTPDSFSDGGHADTAVERAQAMVAAGADLLDVGGESTRPGAAPVDLETELTRTLPVLAALQRACPGVPLSIDTSKPQMAERAVAAGAVLINDVTGLRDPAMLEVVRSTGVAACAMHMQGTPRTMQVDPTYGDVMETVLDELEATLRRVEAAGVPRSHVLVDPGIGFGKTLAHNLFLLRRAADLRLLGAPVLIGTSRKGFLGALTGKKVPAERATASAASVAVAAVLRGVDVVRVHDVAETRDALAVADAVARARAGGTHFGA
jgi:dihydropteroate synthase